MRALLTGLLLLLLTLAPAGSRAAPGTASSAGPIDPAVLTERPKLIVVVVIDQLRADYLTRLRPRFLPATQRKGRPGGFNWLAAHGGWYPQAQHKVMNALTAPGHATILTGAYPGRHGVVLNRWFEPGDQSVNYCVGDEGFKLIGTRPTGPPRGTAPTALVGETLGDALRVAFPKTRTASISLKDRAAILLGGFSSDATLWFDDKGFQFVTSSFYTQAERLPDWADAVNDRLGARRGSTWRWEATGEGAGVSADGGPFALDLKIGSRESTASPYGLEITTDMAIAAVDGLGLGRSGATDLLAVSYSPLDFLGHRLGPTHRQIEELLVAHDRELARLLAHLETAVPGGLDHVVIALTGDHGAPPTPAWLQRHRLPVGGLSDAELKAGIDAALTKAFGPLTGGPWVAFADKLNFYLDTERLTAQGHSFPAAQAVAAAYLRSHPGIGWALTLDELTSGRSPDGLWGELIRNTYFPGRSGHIIGLPLPFRSTRTEPVIHMTGYAYDRYVPLMIAGAHLRPGVYGQAAEIIDLAPTLAFMAGVVPPSLTEGRVLHELFAPATVPPAR